MLPRLHGVVIRSGTLVHTIVPIQLELRRLERGIPIVVGSTSTSGELSVLLTLNGPNEGLARVVEVQAQVRRLAGGTRRD